MEIVEIRMKKEKEILSETEKFRQRISKIYGTDLELVVRMNKLRGERVGEIKVGEGIVVNWE